ncbi:50S ribosomal protein L29 [Candidatus Saccharibacteria bacterium]|nr:50S ribosomal protein L29 [Candidatus Saccharibacteria bacterium]
MTTATELRKKSIADLRVDLAKMQRELAEARRANAARELANPAKMKDLRREIARLHTIILEMKQAADKEKV